MVEANSKCPKCAQGTMKLIPVESNSRRNCPSKIDSQPSVIIAVISIKLKLWPRMNSR